MKIDTIFDKIWLDISADHMEFLYRYSSIMMINEKKSTIKKIVCSRKEIISFIHPTSNLFQTLVDKI